MERSSRTAPAALGGPRHGRWDSSAGDRYFAQLDTPRTDCHARCDHLRREERRRSNALRSGSNPNSHAGRHCTNSASSEPDEPCTRSCGDLPVVFSPFESGALTPWALDAKVEEVEISPDGKDVVVEEGERLLRIPITEEGLIEVAQRGITREFTKSECERFLPGHFLPQGDAHCSP